MRALTILLALGDDSLRSSPFNIICIVSLVVFASLCGWADVTEFWESSRDFSGIDDFVVVILQGGLDEW